jgi:hypothetical protein
VTNHLALMGAGKCLEAVSCHGSSACGANKNLNLSLDGICRKNREYTSLCSVEQSRFDELSCIELTAYCVSL